MSGPSVTLPEVNLAAGPTVITPRSGTSMFTSRFAPKSRPAFFRTDAPKRITAHLGRKLRNGPTWKRLAGGQTAACIRIFTQRQHPAIDETGRPVSRHMYRPYRCGRSRPPRATGPAECDPISRLLTTGLFSSAKRRYWSSGSTRLRRSCHRN